MEELKTELREALKQIPGLRKAVRLVRGQPAEDPREYLLRKMPKESVCAEIGVYKGHFSQWIIHQVNPKRLHLIDPWEHEDEETYQNSWWGGLEAGQSKMDGIYEHVRGLFSDEISKGRVVVHRGYSSDVVDDFHDEYFDWIYIDGDHQYRFVKQDLNLYYPKVKVGGYIAGDDYGYEGWWDNGVQKAVDEFVMQCKNVHLDVKGGQFIIEKEA
jgi:hypothetical protein